MELTAVPATQFSSVQLTDILNACFEAYLVPVTQSVEGFVQRFSGALRQIRQVHDFASPTVEGANWATQDSCKKGAAAPSAQAGVEPPLNGVTVNYVRAAERP